MKKSVLAILKKAKPNYISGEEISSSLKVSRTAIWKHINALKEDGYYIDSQPKKGYQLIAAPDLLLPDEVTDGLETNIIGHSVVHLDNCGSTNDVAKDFAAQGVPEGTIVVAEMQTKGRGRLGRQWISPKSEGIWLSIVLKPNFNPTDAAKITLAAAVAISQAIDDVTGIRVGIKWPNDLVYQGKKLVGILTEINAEIDRINYVILGIGINVNVSEFPEELAKIATSLKQIIGQDINRIQLLQRILVRVEEQYSKSISNRFNEVIEEWKKWNITTGNEVNVTSINETYFGKAIDVDDEGRLIIEMPNGEIRKVLSGDVTLRSK